MVESGKSTTTEDLQRAVDRLLAEGADGAQIAEMVAERIIKYPMVENPTDIVDLLAAADTPPENEGVVIYEPDELPEGLIDLPTASKRYGVNNTTMRSWVAKGLVQAKGRLRAPAAKGGYVVVSEADLCTYMNSPRNKGGRPKKPRK
jgi:hypothetical protein